MRNLSKLDYFLIILAIVFFLVFTSLVVFRRDWLDSFFYGDTNKNLVSLTPEFEDTQTPFVELNILGDGTEASVFLDSEYAVNLVGAEIFLVKEGNLEIKDMTCEIPFECFIFDVDGDKISLITIVSPDSVDILGPGEILLGTFEYSGSGKVYLDVEGESFVSDFENPEFNILKINEKEFLL